MQTQPNTIDRMARTRAPSIDKTVKPKYAKKLNNDEEAMMVLRLEMYKRNTEILAEKVGVSVACIYAIQSGRTKWPRPKTFFGLLKHLDLEMHLIPRGQNHGR